MRLTVNRGTTPKQAAIPVTIDNYTANGDHPRAEAGPVSLSWKTAADQHQIAAGQ